MNPWSNIETTSHDSEIVEIDRFEKTLEPFPRHAQKIRELITGFEACHFKYQQHIKYIKDSILNLIPNIDLKKIGTNHIRKGENAWKKDKTGRSFLGQRYIWAINNWLGVKTVKKNIEHYNQELGQKITKWLGKKDPEKERLIRLLKARLLWDWESYEKFRFGNEENELEYQVCRLDICHYAFPKNLNLVLQGIGKMKAVEVFHGCGSCNSDIKKYAKKEFIYLNDQLQAMLSEKKPDKKKKIRAWLTASLAKTIKEQTGLKLALFSSFFPAFNHE